MFGRTILTVIIIGVFSVVPTLGATFIVNSLTDTGPGNCNIECTLRDAIAVSTGGDKIIFSVTGVINLDAGKGVLNLNFPAGSFAIIGPGPDKLTISGGNATRVFTISDGHITIKGLTITKGSNGAGAGGIGNAVNIGSSLTLEDCVITGNASTGGTGGGGIGSENQGDLTITNCLISNNTSISAGGGINFTGGGRLEINNSVISGNITNGAGGGLRLSGATSVAIISGTTISNNTALNGGGLLKEASSQIFLTDSIISGNTATSDGGGLHIAGSATLNKNVIVNNIVSVNDVDGSGVYVQSGTTHAENNWWGCNAGPDNDPCDRVAILNFSGGSIVFAPWLVISPMVTPNPLEIGQTAEVFFDLAHNSDGEFILSAALPFINDQKAILSLTSDIGATFVNTAFTSAASSNDQLKNDASNLLMLFLFPAMAGLAYVSRKWPQIRFVILLVALSIGLSGCALLGGGLGTSNIVATLSTLQTIEITAPLPGSATLTIDIGGQIFTIVIDFVVELPLVNNQPISIGNHHV